MLLLCGPALYGALLLGGVSGKLDVAATGCCVDRDSGPVWVYCKKDGSPTFGEVEYHLTDRSHGATLVFADVTSKQLTPYRLPNRYAVLVLHESKAAVLVRLFSRVDDDHAVGVRRICFADGKHWAVRAENDTIPYAGEALDHLKQIKNLPGLNLSGSKLTAKELQCFKELTNLQWLNLSGTNLRDEDLPSLAGLKALRHLRLVNTQVTPQGAKQLADMLPEAKIEFRFPNKWAPCQQATTRPVP